jgi:DNA-binding LytR/AlgR family response regulator
MNKILVIEDDETVRELITELLELAGYEVYSAVNGIDGIKAARKQTPNLIVCDVSMPRMDGYAVKSELNKNPNTAAIPFLFLTAKNEIHDLRHGMQLGADDYLFKPFLSSELLKSIEIRLQKVKDIRVAHGKVAAVAQSQESTKAKFSNDSFILLMVNSKPENLKIDMIVYIEADEKYSHVFLEDGKNLMVRKLMKDWETALPEEYFIRIHRSIILNMKYISKFEKWFNNSYRVYVKNVAEPFEISRRYAAKLKSKFAL